MFFLPPFFGVWRKTRLSLWENNTKPKTILLFFFKEKKKINKKKIFFLNFFFYLFSRLFCVCCSLRADVARYTALSQLTTIFLNGHTTKQQKYIFFLLFCFITAKSNSIGHKIPFVLATKNVFIKKTRLIFLSVHIEIIKRRKERGVGGIVMETACRRGRRPWLVFLSFHSKSITRQRPTSPTH